MKSIKKTVYIILLVTLSSYNTTKLDNFDWGYVIEGSYENKFLGMDWSVPENREYDDTFDQQWTKVHNLDIHWLAESSYEIKMCIKMLPEQINESIVFQLTKLKPETVGNPVIILYEENFTTMDGANVLDMNDYLAKTVKEVRVSPQMTLDT